MTPAVILGGLRSLSEMVPSSRGGGRFTLVARIGAGAMGEVYEAQDEDGGGRVALKSLVALDPRSVTRFKHEFRAIRDLRHPGLIAMHELVCDEAGWFFTMDLLAGTSLWEHLRPEAYGALRGVTRTDSSLGDAVEPVAGAAVDGAVPVARITGALAQLGDALAYLHAAGKVHRDLKPSNVLVDGAGRVVVLDLGLVSDHDRVADRAGSVAYMAPEQIERARLTTAADLYAVGVILHEALTGRLPFEGPRADVLRAKQADDRGYRAALAALAVAQPAAARLVALCVALLDAEPTRRPTAAELVARCGGAGVAPAAAPAGGRTLVGREPELAAFRDALAAGGATAVLVTGPPGVGKTALLDHVAAAASAGARRCCAPSAPSASTCRSARSTARSSSSPSTSRCSPTTPGR